jgi:hypothetical protein
VVGAVIGACALAAAIAVMVRRPHIAPPMAELGDGVAAPAVVPPEILPPGPGTLAPATETRIAAGTSPTCRMISPGATACLGAGSEVTTARLEAPRRLLDLVRGRVVVSLAPQAPGTSFGVATPAGTVTAVGTIFSVEILGNGDTIARCERGEVVVQASGGAAEQRLLAGEQLRIGDVHAAAALAQHDRRRDLALLTYREDRPAARGEKPSEVAEREERPSARNEKSAEAARGIGEPARGASESRSAAEPSPTTMMTAPTATPTPPPASPPTAAPARAPVRDRPRLANARRLSRSGRRLPRGLC